MRFRVTIYSFAGKTLRSAVEAVVEANKKHGFQLICISRSDSCLRGHFPLETDVMHQVLEENGIRVWPVTPAVRRHLLKNCAAEAGKEITLVEGLADGAFAAGQSGDSETHDRLIAEAAQRIADSVDLFVLAQGSMARMEQRLSELTGKPVLSSPVLGVLGLRKRLGLD